jgi:hypothetical protein
MEQLLQPLQVTSLDFRVKDLPGEETAETRQTLMVSALDEQGRPVELSLSLSTIQLVQIIKHFFWESTVRFRWAAHMVERLLTKRWAVHTVAQSKEDSTFRAQCTILDFYFDERGRRVMRRKD